PVRTAFKLMWRILLLGLSLVALPGVAEDRFDSRRLASGIAILAQDFRTFEQLFVERAFRINLVRTEPNEQIPQYWTSFVPRQTGTGISRVRINIGQPITVDEVMVNFSQNICLLPADLENALKEKPFLLPPPVPSSTAPITQTLSFVTGPGTTWQ